MRLGMTLQKGDYHKEKLLTGIRYRDEIVQPFVIPFIQQRHISAEQRSTTCCVQVFAYRSPTQR
jgi:hypothetical protein